MPITATRLRPTVRRQPKNGRRPATAKPALNALNGYLAGSQSPLTSLLFVLPLLVLHEIGVHWYASLPARGVEYRVTAFSLMTRFFHAFGASGRYLPVLAVIAVLLSWHIARRDRWVFNTPLLPLMALESMAWAVPLLAVHFLFSARSPIYLAAGEWKIMASLYLGAGVYEELVFRLAGFAVLSFLLIDLGRLSRRVATPLIVVIAAAAFSAYHMLGLLPIPWQALVFVGLRGVYYGIIFLERGFGVSVGVHTAYDLIFLTLLQVNNH